MCSCPNGCDTPNGNCQGCYWNKNNKEVKNNAND